MRNLSPTLRTLFVRQTEGAIMHDLAALRALDVANAQLATAVSILHPISWITSTTAHFTASERAWFRSPIGGSL